MSSHPDLLNSFDLSEIILSDSENEIEEIPLPGSFRSPAHRYLRQCTTASTTTPLIKPVYHRNRNSDRKRRDSVSTSRLFDDDVRQNLSTTTNNTASKYMRPEGLAGWFFGFMYEDAKNETLEFDDDDNDDTNINAGVWNSLNFFLFASYTLTTAAAALPVLLIPAIGQDFLQDESFSSIAASSAVLGIACGKFFNAQVADFLGARRTSSLYSILLALSLLSLSSSKNAVAATTSVFFVEFFQSVQWPCMVVILNKHYVQNTQYESGIFLTSIASRFGALIGIPIFSLLLRQLRWRIVCFVGAWIASIGSSIMYLYVMDSPTKTNDPQNPLHPKLLQQMETLIGCTSPKRCLVVCINVVCSIISNNVLPSFRKVLTSGTFWVVSIAHTGSAMVRTAERIIGTYFYDTSFGYLSENNAGGLTIYLSLGTVLGLIFAGKIFMQRKGRQRKLLVSRLYAITIIACYSLAILAIPRLRHFVDSPDLICFFQVIFSFVMGFGSSVMYSLIPGLVGTAFGPHKGSYIAYTDGVAFGLSSIVWKIVANAVANGNSEGGGWAYGWAAVALLIVLCAILMTEFMEHYFVRSPGRRGGNYETIIFA